MLDDLLKSLIEALEVRHDGARLFQLGTSWDGKAHALVFDDEKQYKKFLELTGKTTLFFPQGEFSLKELRELNASRPYSIHVGYQDKTTLNKQRWYEEELEALRKEVASLKKGIGPPKYFTG